MKKSTNDEEFLEKGNAINLELKNSSEIYIDPFIHNHHRLDQNRQDYFYQYEPVHNDTSEFYKDTPDRFSRMNLSRMSCPTYNEMAMLADPAEINHLRNVWKKERNRLAAKKSRDKKAIHLKMLENKERKMENCLQVLKDAVLDYDGILREIVMYLESVIENRSLGHDRFILLFDCLCKLKKPTGENSSFYFRDVSGLLDKPLLVTNERIEDLTRKIRGYLNEILYKYKG